MLDCWIHRIGCFQVLWEALGRPMGDALELLGGSGRLLGGSWELLEHLGSLLEAPDGSEERLLVVLEGSWKHLGASWSALGGLLEALGTLLGAFWSHFGSIWRLFGQYFGAWNASLKQVDAFLKNHEKRCKVLQKSRFGGSLNR